MSFETTFQYKDPATFDTNCHQDVKDLIYLNEISNANWNTHTLDNNGNLQKIISVEPEIQKKTTLFGKITSFFMNCFTRKKQQTPSIKPASLSTAVDKIMTVMSRVASHPEYLSNAKKHTLLEAAKNLSLLADKMDQKEPADAVQKISESMLTAAKPIVEPILELVNPQPECLISEKLEVIPESPLREEQVVPESPSRDEQIESLVPEEIELIPKSHSIDQQAISDSLVSKEEMDSNTPEPESTTPDVEIGASIENDDSISAIPTPMSEPLLQKNISRYVRRSWRFINKFENCDRVNYTHFFYSRLRKYNLLK